MNWVLWVYLAVSLLVTGAEMQKHGESRVKDYDWRATLVANIIHLVILFFIARGGFP